MKVVIITFTRDRLPYTKFCFKRLAQKAGYQYRHIVVDNGSTDGTDKWLVDEGYEVIYNRKNRGISKAFKQAVSKIDDCDLLIKFDNDCEVESKDIISKIVKFYRQNGMKYYISPKVYGLNNKMTPKKVERKGDFYLGELSMIGGIFAVMPFKYVKEYLKLDGAGTDAVASTYFASKGCQIGYIMDLSVNHYLTTNGQIEDLGDNYHKDYKY